MTNEYLRASTLNGVFQFLDKQLIVIPQATTPSTINAGNAEAAIWRGRTYSRYVGYTGTIDGTNAWSDRNGVHFVADETALLPYSFKSIENTPPTNPSIGDVYLVGTSPTGVFAGRTDRIANWTQWQWVFTDAPAGYQIYDESRSGFWHRHQNGHWVFGLTSPNLANNSISPLQLQNPGYLAVGGIFDAPPPGAVNGGLYIVSAAPTAGTDFAGKANELALRRNNAWEFSGTPAAGTTVRNSLTQETLEFEGGSWTVVGVDNPLVFYQAIRPTPATVVPSGPLVTNQSRALVRVNIPAVVRELELEFADLSIDFEGSLRATSSNDAVFSGSWVLRLGNSVDFRIAFSSGRLFDRTLGYNPFRIWGGANRVHQFREAADLAKQYIRMSDYSSRQLEFALEPGTDSMGNPLRFDIRNILAVSGAVIIKGYK